MDYGIAIVPPASISNVIRGIQDQFGDLGIEPHITVKAQGGLGPGLAWLNKVKEIARNTAPFPISLGPASTFGNEVIYTSINSPDLATLHHRILNTLNISEEIIARYFEGEDFTPHITLGMTRAGFNNRDFLKIKELADKEFGRSDVKFDTDFMRIYKFEGGQWGKYEDIYLG